MRIEQNYLNLCLKAAKITEGFFKTNSEFSSVQSNGYNWFSRIYDIKSFKNITKDTLKEVQSHTIVISDINDRLIHKLNTLGFEKVTSQTSMILNLSNYIKNKVSSNIVIINDLGLLEKWYNCIIQIFKIENFTLFRKLLDDDDVIFIAKIQNNTIISTMMVYINGDRAGLHFVGVLPDYRNQGLGNEILKYTLNHLSNSKIKEVVLQSSDLGVNLYKKYGFIEKNSVTHWKYIDDH